MFISVIFLHVIINVFRQIFKISPIAMGLSVSVYVCVATIVHTGHILAKVKNVQNDVGRF